MSEPPAESENVILKRTQQANSIHCCLLFPHLLVVLVLNWILISQHNKANDPQGGFGLRCWKSKWHFRQFSKILLKTEHGFLPPRSLIGGEERQRDRWVLRTPFSQNSNAPENVALSCLAKSSWLWEIIFKACLCIEERAYRGQLMAAPSFRIVVLRRWREPVWKIMV